MGLHIPLDRRLAFLAAMCGRMLASKGRGASLPHVFRLNALKLLGPDIPVSAGSLGKGFMPFGPAAQDHP
jgi:hypothetical protein